MLDGVRNLVQRTQAAADDEPDHDTQHRDQLHDGDHSTARGTRCECVTCAVGLRDLDRVAVRTDVEDAPTVVDGIDRRVTGLDPGWQDRQLIRGVDQAVECERPVCDQRRRTPRVTAQQRANSRRVHRGRRVLSENRPRRRPAPSRAPTRRRAP